jgi:hypothetical protein
MTAIRTDGRQYSVVLIDVGSGADVYLNKVLLERNLAVPDNIEQILEKLAPVPYEANNTSEQSDEEPEEREVVKHSEESDVKPEEREVVTHSEWDEEGYEFVIDDLQQFVVISLPIL